MIKQVFKKTFTGGKLLWGSSFSSAMFAFIFGKTFFGLNWFYSILLGVGIAVVFYLIRFVWFFVASIMSLIRM
jgi:hypothetical protein